MKEENCIDVKNVYNLSINYLSRFFGAAGKIIHVYKDENSKYVTIEFAHNYAVQKALRFNGRVLDKQPIKIKKWSENITLMKSSQDKKSQQKSQIKKDNSQQPLQISPKIDYTKSKFFKNEFWTIIKNQMIELQCEKNQKMIAYMLIWALGNELMIDIKHLQHYKVNTRSNYIYTLLESQIINIFEIINNSTQIDFKIFGLKIQIKDSVAVWLQMSSSNIEEEQSKIQSSSLRDKMFSAIKIKHRKLAGIFIELYSASFCLNQIEENEMLDLLSLEFDLETTQDDNYTGIIENVGVEDIFYENQKYSHPNTCIYLQKMAQFPQIFNCSMRMVGCEDVQFQEKSWCDIYSASLSIQENQGKKTYFLIKKLQLQRFSLKDHNIIFENSQFSYENIWRQSKKYEKLTASKSLRVICVRKKQDTQSQTLQLAPTQQKGIQSAYQSPIIVQS